MTDVANQKTMNELRTLAFNPWRTANSFTAVDSNGNKYKIINKLGDYYYVTGSAQCVHKRARLKTQDDGKTLVKNAEGEVEFLTNPNKNDSCGGGAKSPENTEENAPIPGGANRAEIIANKFHVFFLLKYTKSCRPSAFPPS